MDYSLEFTEAENKIRTRWLIWNINIPAVVGGLSYFLGLLIAIAETNASMVSDILVSVLYVSAALYINYYCSYKKQGTSMLILGMITSFFVILFRICSANIIIPLLPKWHSYLLLILAIVTIELIAVYYSYNLLKVNKSIRKRRFDASPVYINALSVFSTATNMDELNELYSKLNASDPSDSSVYLATAFAQQEKRIKMAQ